jgi:hypothetical protein
METTHKYDGHSQFSQTSRLLRRFIEGFLKLARPMTAPTQKGKEFKWTEACEKSFQELNTRLTKASILTLLDIHQSFIVYCDASRQGLCGRTS